MPKDEMYELLLQCWTVAYEKSIVAKERQFAKKLIDKACREAVEDLTKRLLDAGSITEEDTVGNRFDTMDDAIRHHISNLVKGDIFTEVQEFTIEARTNYRADVLEITVDNCTYQKSCEWALHEPEFRKNGQYRCQRLGCFVGAVDKYLKEDKLPKDQRQKLNYHMENIMQEIEDDNKTATKCRCNGFIFVDIGMRDGFLEAHPTQFPN